MSFSKLLFVSILTLAIKAYRMIELTDKNPSLNLQEFDFAVIFFYDDTDTSN